MRTWDKQGDGLIAYEEFEDYYKVTDAAPAFPCCFFVSLRCAGAGARHTGMMNGCFLSSPSTTITPRSAL